MGKKNYSYIVTNINDSGKGSLRDIICKINENKSCGTSFIKFNICSSSLVIQPGINTGGLPLPDICYPVNINGLNSNKKKIQLDGTYATGGIGSGFSLSGKANNSKIKNFKFTLFVVEIYLGYIKNTSIKNNKFSSDVINQSSIIGNCICNLNVCNNKFVTTSTDTNGIFLTNPTGKIKIENNSLCGFSDVTSASGGNGVYILLNNGGTLKTLNILNNKFNNFSNPFGGLGGNGVFIDFEGLGGNLVNFNVNKNKISNITGNLSNIFLGGTGILINLNVTGSKIGDFKLLKNNFDTITSGASAIITLLNGTNTSISKILSTQNTFNNLNETSDDVLNCAFLMGLNASGTYICTFKDSCSTYTNISDGAQMIVPLLTSAGSTIDNLIVKGSTFNNFTSGTIGVFPNLFGNSKITNIDISDCSFTNFSLTTADFFETFGIYVYNGGGQVDNFNVSNCKFDNFSSLGVGDVSLAFAVLAEAAYDGTGTIIGTISNYNVKECSFDNFNSSVGPATNLDVGGVITNTRISNCKLSNMTNTFNASPLDYIAFVLFGGNQINTYVKNCKFDNITGSASFIETFFLAPGNSSMNIVDISGNTFKNISGASQGILNNMSTAGGTNTISNLSITDNKFLDIQDTSNAILLPTTGGVISDMNISNNKFTGPNATTNGWATLVLVDAGDTTCLNFKNNNANPIANAYLFTNTDLGGIFNLTSNSDSSTNVGQITTVGTVNPAGSCVCSC